MLNEKEFSEKLNTEPLEKIFHDFCLFLGFNNLAEKIYEQFSDTIDKQSSERGMASN